MLIGRLKLPDISVRPEATALLENWCQSTGERRDEVAMWGPVGRGRSALPRDDANAIRVAAALAELKGNPENGFALIHLAWALAGQGRFEDAVAILAELERTGLLSEERDYWARNPSFLAGWILAVGGQYEAALKSYEKALESIGNAQKGPVLAQKACLHQEQRSFEEAARCYEQAILEFGRPPAWWPRPEEWHRDYASQVQLLKELAALASKHRSLPGGISLCEQGVFDDS